jgi:hypothetical protein
MNKGEIFKTEHGYNFRVFCNGHIYGSFTSSKSKGEILDRVMEYGCSFAQGNLIDLTNEKEAARE